MAGAARIHAVERGKDPRAYPLFAFGGAGPVHAYRVAKILDAPELVIPLGAGVTSALGFLVAPLAFDFVRSFFSPLADLDFGARECPARRDAGGGRGDTLRRWRHARADHLPAHGGDALSRAGPRSLVPLPDGALQPRYAVRPRRRVRGRSIARCTVASPRGSRWKCSTGASSPAGRARRSTWRRKRPGRRTPATALKGERSIYLPGGGRLRVGAGL